MAPPRDGSVLPGMRERSALLGEAPPLIDRTELAPRVKLGETFATVAHLTDAHILDAESPARVPCLDRLGPPFGSTFRPHETLTAQVLDGAVRAIAALAPNAVIQGGDLIDNAQANELSRALAALRGGLVEPRSAGAGYFGVQCSENPDASYYRPDLDAPLHPGLLELATSSFQAHGLAVPCYPVLGDHDLLVQGIIPPSTVTQAIARGDRAVWSLPDNVEVPADVRRAAMSAPDGLVDGTLLNLLIRQLLLGPSVKVPPDPRRGQLSPGEILAALRDHAGLAGDGKLLDYVFDVGPRLRVLVLDLVRREGGSEGLVHPGQPEWVESELSNAGDRWVLVVTHHPLLSSVGGDSILSVLDGHPRVLAALAGHIHRNEIRPRPAANGGYWLICTASLIDYPQQARALRIRATAEGAAIQTWVIDHAAGGVQGMGDISRELATLDLKGRRPQGSAGKLADRNVTLYCQ